MPMIRSRSAAETMVTWMTANPFFFVGRRAMRPSRVWSGGRPFYRLSAPVPGTFGGGERRGRLVDVSERVTPREATRGGRRGHRRTVRIARPERQPARGPDEEGRR